MVSMDDTIDAAAKNKWPRVPFMGHVAKAAAAPSKLKVSQMSTTGGWFGARGKSPTAQARRAPPRHPSKGKNYAVKTPQKMLYSLGCVFLLLPLGIFMWKETHLHKEEAKHSKSGTRGHHHHHNAFVTWMEDAEKEASDEHILDPNNDDSNTTLTGLIGDFLGLTHDDDHHDHDDNHKNNTTKHHSDDSHSKDKDNQQKGDNYAKIKSHKSNNGDGQLILDLKHASQDTPEAKQKEDDKANISHKSNNGHGQLTLDLKNDPKEDAQQDQKEKNEKGQEATKDGTSPTKVPAVEGQSTNQTNTTQHPGSAKKKRRAR